MEYIRRFISRGSACLLVLFMAAGCASVPAHHFNEQLAAVLLQLGERDQQARQAAMANRTDTNLRATIQRVDHENREYLRGIVKQHGWPGRSLVGEHSAHAAWLVAQHSDEDPAFQKQCLKLMSAAPDGEVSRVDLAFLTDRVLINAGKKQRYGTQFKQVGWRFVPEPMDDWKKVDERRRKIGLPPLAQYAREMQELYGPPGGPR